MTQVGIAQDGVVGRAYEGGEFQPPMLGSVTTVLTFAGAIIGSGSFASLATLILKTRADRRAVDRGSRRSLYIDLLTLLQRQSAYMRDAAFDHGLGEPEVPRDQIDRLNALMSIDSSLDVRELAIKCFGLIQRFSVSRALGAPVDEGANGLFEHRFEAVRGKDAEAVTLIMRLALGKISDEFDRELDNIGRQIRKEIGSR